MSAAREYERIIERVKEQRDEAIARAEKAESDLAAEREARVRAEEQRNRARRLIDRFHFSMLRAEDGCTESELRAALADEPPATLEIAEPGLYEQLQAWHEKNASAWDAVEDVVEEIVADRYGDDPPKGGE